MYINVYHLKEKNQESNSRLDGITSCLIMRCGWKSDLLSNVFTATLWKEDMKTDSYEDNEHQQDEQI